MEWRGGDSGRKGPWEQTLLQAERRGHRERPRLLRWMLSGSKECSEGRNTLYLFKVSHQCPQGPWLCPDCWSPHRGGHGNGDLLPARDCPEHGTQRTPNALVRCRLLCLCPSGALGWGQGLDAELWVSLEFPSRSNGGRGARHRAVLRLLTQERWARPWGGGRMEKGLGPYSGPGSLLPGRRKSWQQGREEMLGQARRWPWRDSLDGKREVSCSPGLRQGSVFEATGFMQCWRGLAWLGRGQQESRIITVGK